MHVDAKCAAVNLRYSEFDHVKEFDINATLVEITLDCIERANHFRSKFGVLNARFEFFRHELPPQKLFLVRRRRAGRRYREYGAKENIEGILVVGEWATGRRRFLVHGLNHAAS